MGGSISKPKVLSRSQLLAMTAQPREFVNQLFQVMITQLTPKDILDLGNRAKCKTYVFVMADAIYKTFDAIKVQPTKDAKTGVLLYKKMDEMVKGTGSQVMYEHCLSLAYFYVRIFQIFGALALTVIDDPSSGQVLGYLQQQQKPPVRDIPRIRGVTAVPFRGGEVTDSRVKERLSKAKLGFLAGLINKIDSTERFNRFSFEYSDSLQLWMPRDSASGNILLVLVSDSSYIVSKITSSSRTTTTNLFGSSNRFTVNIQSFTQMNSELVTEKKLDKTVSLLVQKVNDEWLSKSATSTSDEPRLVTESFIEIMSKARDKLAEMETVKQGVNAFGRTRNVQMQRQAPTGQYDVGVAEGLWTGYMIKYLEGKEKGSSMPYCIARALQLIDANALEMVQPQVKTHVCETSFEPAHGMIPKVGEPLSKSPGLLSMNQLFYTDTFTEKTSTGDFAFQVKPADAVPGEYVQFLSMMRDVFSKDAKPVAKFGDIKFADVGCDQTTKGKTLTVSDQKAMTNMYQTVQMLFNLQTKHSLTVMNFLRTKLVEISGGSVGGVKQSSVRINPNLTKGGVVYLNRVAYEARQLLVNYYSSCEKVYQLGATAASRAGKV